MRPRRDRRYSGVVFSTPGVQTTSEGCLVGQWGVGACVLRPVCSSGGGGRGGGGGGGSGLGGSGWARGERTGSSQCVRASWNRSLLKWQMIWTSRQEMRGPQPPFRCSAQHYVRTASWCSKAGHVRSWRCLPPRRASMAMPRSTWSVLTSLLARNTKISARPLIIWMSPTSKGMTSS
ncbi:eukaryotic translation initiation factor 5A-1 isoform X2 [Lontra canadensis]|uniref:eukaryotic translation initiation factor 5A-1 isoform X2 n=1 Tax=Lontra canadensis TaxID=76717 RepID=UPI0013F38BAF|nr:eukaryotic translation initiation factor 5A-1 isoform X2 [Lontra canadensis]